MEKFEVKNYDLPDGSIPVVTFLDSVDKKMKAKLLRAIALLKEKGNELREPESKHLSDGIFELRAIAGSDISRVLYFFMIGKRAVLTHGFVKKTQKTPPSEIDRAKKYRDEYLSRKENKQ